MNTRAIRHAPLGTLFLLLIAQAGCTRTSEVKTDEKLAFQEELKGRESEHETVSVQTGPETITTTTEEYGSPQETQAEAPAGGLPVLQVVEGRARQTGPGTPQGQHPAEASTGLVLVKRTVTVDQRGPSSATKTDDKQKVETASIHEKQEKASDTKKKTSYWPPIWMWIAGALFLGGLGWAIKRGVKLAL